VWRRFGDVAFAAVVAIAVSLEAIPLAYLTWVLLGRFVGASGPRPVTVALGVAATTALGLVMVTAYLLAYQFVSERREAALAERRRRWVARWLEVVFHEARRPDGPLSRDATEALLDLREALRGEASDRVSDLLVHYAVAGTLAREARSHRVGTQLDALDCLSRARAVEALPTLLAGMAHQERAVRVASARATARTVAAIEDRVALERAARDVVTALERVRLPIGVVEEMLLLAEDAAPALVGELLLREEAPASSLRAALDAVARLQLLVFGEDAARLIGHADPEVRAAALRAVEEVRLLPESARGAVLEACHDETDFVRIHAVAAARLLPREDAVPALWEALGDRSWWVRRSAADAMAALGSPGLGELGRAALGHPDRYARDIAAQTLRDRIPEVVQAVAG
jgi:hypothetical protein